MNELIRKNCEDHRLVIEKILSDNRLQNTVGEIAKLNVNTFLSGNKILLCGNGGSAADAQHIATELVGRFFLERSPLDAEALTVNTSLLTAIANDYTFERVFARQVEAKGRPGDLLIGITTSGTSKNIIAAFEAAQKIGMKNICFTGMKAPASLDELCDVVLRVPSSCTPRIQEVHILIGHILCEYIEMELFGR